MQRCPPAFPAGKKQSGPSLSEILHHPVCRTLPLAQGLGGISRLSWCIKLDAFIGESFSKAFILCRVCRSSGHPGGSDGHGMMENYPCIPPLESGHVPAPGTLPVTLGWGRGGRSPPSPHAPAFGKLPLAVPGICSLDFVPSTDKGSREPAWLKPVSPRNKLIFLQFFSEIRQQR